MNQGSTCTQQIQIKIRIYHYLTLSLYVKKTAGGRPLIGRGKRKILYFQVQFFAQCSNNIHIKVNQ